MASLSDNLSGAVPAEIVALLTTSINSMLYSSGAPTTVTSGAIPTTSPLTFISTTGAQSYSLANGSFNGQLKTLRVTVTDNTATVTPAAAVGFTSFTMDAVNDWVVLEWHGSDVGTAGWRIIASISISIT